MKLCIRCNIEKDKNNFSIARSRYDGLSAYCKECVHKAYKIRRESNKEYYLEKGKIQRERHGEKNKQKHREWARNYYQKNKELVIRKERENYHRYRDKRKIWRDNRWQYKIINSARAIIIGSLRKGGYKKSSKTNALLGADYSTVINHLESQFKDGMSWDNYGRWGWHMDHIIPLASATNEDELIKLFHYTNLQPLWWRDNIIKGAKIIPIL